MVFKNSEVWQISTEALIKHLEGLTAPDSIYWDSRELKKTGRKFQSQPWSLWRKVTKDDAGKWVFVEEETPQQPVQQTTKPAAQEAATTAADAFIARAVTNEYKVTYITLTQEEKKFQHPGSWAVVEVDTTSNVIIGQTLLSWDSVKVNFAKILKETIEPKKSRNKAFYLVYWANEGAAFDVMPLHTNAQTNKAAACLYRQAAQDAEYYLQNGTPW